jgi:hypothetical protein
MILVNGEGDGNVGDLVRQSEKQFYICHSDEERSDKEESAIPRREGWPQPADKSPHAGLTDSISATFLSRRHFLISVSRAMALFTYLKTS